MFKLYSSIGLVGLIAFILATADTSDQPAEASSDQESVQSVQREFIGTGKCKTCHMSAKKGAQYKVWKEKKHAQAFDVLASEEAMKIAVEKNIANPQESAECLQCHVDGHGVDAVYLGAKYAKEDGVGCESCHGAGGDYWKKTVMKDITMGKVDGATLGLIKPTEKVCVQCHNEKSPTFKGFVFEEMYKKIAHPYPDGFRESLTDADDTDE